MALNVPSDSIPARVNQPHQFSYENGILITYAEPELVRGELTIGPDSFNPHGYVHGGALFTLADTVGGCCACSRGGSCVTSNASFEFLRPAVGSKIFCEAAPKKMGKKLSTIQVTLTNDKDTVVATGTFTFFMLEE